MENIKKVVLAYSGGLDTSVIIPWLKENYNGCEVIAVCADIGQGDELNVVHDKALKSGASKVFIEHLTEDFVANYVFPTLKAGAVYEGKYLLGTSFARPLIAKRLVEIAKAEGADAIAHGATGKGNDQVRFESAVAALAPQLDVIAPWRIWDMQSREELLAYLNERNIPCKTTLKKIYSRDANVLHISTEGGELENTWNPASENVWVWTTDPLKAPDTPETVEITVEKGVVTKINGKDMTPFESISFLNEIGARHGVGRVDITENRLVGMKSRGCYETPGGTIIYKALRAIEQLVLDKNTRLYREHLAIDFAQLVYDGRWFTRLREIMMAAADEIAKDVNGKVVVRLYKGNIDVIQKDSPNSLFNFDFVTFGADQVYDQKDAEGFIRLYSLPSRIRALNEQQRKQ